MRAVPIRRRPTKSFDPAETTRRAIALLNSLPTVSKGRRRRDQKKARIRQALARKWEAGG